MSKTTKTFREFLEDKKLSKNNIDSICSRVNRIKAVYDIETEYLVDKCAELMDDFTYTSADEKNGVMPSVRIDIKGSYREGLSSLKQALKFYIEYLDTLSLVKKTKTSSSYFEGNFADFVLYIGPKCRNAIQALTKSKKSSVKYCECCGAKKTLQAAHRNGMERNDIVKNILESDYKLSNDYYRVCLEEFIEKFKKAHMPLEDVFYFLCEDCHNDYDGKDKAKRDAVESAVKANKAK